MNPKAPAGSKILFVMIPILLVLAMSALIYFKVVQIRNTASELAAQQAGLLQDQERLAQLESLKAGGSDMKRKFEEVTALIPQEPMEEDVIDFIRRQAALAMSDLIQVKFGQRAAAGKYTDMPLDISFSGSFGDFIRFIGLIENGKRALRIDSAAVSAAQDDPSKIRADLKATVFCLDSAAAQQTQQQPIR